MNNQSEIQLLTSSILNSKAMNQRMKKTQKKYETLAQEASGLREQNQQLHFELKLERNRLKCLEERYEELLQHVMALREEEKKLKGQLWGNVEYIRKLYRINKGLNDENTGLRSTVRELSRDHLGVGKAS